MLKIITRPLSRIFSSFGYDIIKRQNPFAPEKKGNWLEKLGIETIIDVGANEGQFIQLISKVLPGKKIIAFEPIHSCYNKLLANTKQSNVLTFNCGLSDHNDRLEINVSGNMVSSSVLPMENLHKSLYPKSEYVKKETIELKVLDEVMAQIMTSGNILLKIDVQGYENKVIAGATNTIGKAVAIIVESSYNTLYTGQWLFDETYDYFTSRGFKFAGVIDQARSNETGIPIYGDAIFVKKDLYGKIFS